MKEYIPYDSMYNKCKNRRNENDGGMKIDKEFSGSDGCAQKLDLHDGYMGVFSL